MNSNSSSSACMKMSQRPAQVSLPSTHSGEAFIDFVYDMLQYTITKENLVWIEPSDHERKTEKVFEESFGDTVILYHKEHVEQFLNFDKDVDIQRMKNYLWLFCKRAFKGDNLLREFIRYCALLFDIGSYEIQYWKRPYYIYPIVGETSEVFDKYLKPHFTKLGGWDALYREADEYTAQVANSNSPLETTDDSEESASDLSSVF